MLPTFLGHSLWGSQVPAYQPCRGHFLWVAGGAGTLVHKTCRAMLTWFSSQRDWAEREAARVRGSACAALRGSQPSGYRRLT